MISLEDAYADYAAALKRSADSLTDNEKRQALFSHLLGIDWPEVNIEFEKERFLAIAKHQLEPGVCDKLGDIYDDND